MKPTKTVFSRAVSLLLVLLLLAALAPAALAGPVTTAIEITNQARWDALFDASGAQIDGSGANIIIYGSVTSSYPVSCRELVIDGGHFQAQADIFGNVQLESGELTVQEGSAIYGDVFLNNAVLYKATIYGSCNWTAGSVSGFFGADVILHNGVLSNNTGGSQVVRINGVDYPLASGKTAQFTDCDEPSLDWVNPTQNGDGRLSWPAVPGAAEYTVYLHKDMPQSAPVATITTGELSCDFTDALKAGGSGDYFLSAKTLAAAPQTAAEGNLTVFYDSEAFSDYMFLAYTAPDPVPDPAPDPVPAPAPAPKANPDTGVRAPAGACKDVAACFSVLYAVLQTVRR